MGFFYKSLGKGQPALVKRFAIERGDGYLTSITAQMYTFLI